MLGIWCFRWIVSDTFKWPNGQQSRLPCRRSVFVSQEGRPPIFILCSLSQKARGGDYRRTNFVFWVAGSFLSASRWVSMAWSKVLYGQLKFQLMCIRWKNVSEDFWINLWASLEDWLVWWMCTQSRRLLHKEGTKESKPPESCCHSNYRYLHQRLLSIVSLFSKSNIYFWIDLKSVISSTAWAHQAASV